MPTPIALIVPAHPRFLCHHYLLIFVFDLCEQLSNWKTFLLTEVAGYAECS